MKRIKMATEDDVFRLSIRRLKKVSVIRQVVTAARVKKSVMEDEKKYKQYIYERNCCLERKK